MRNSTRCSPTSRKSSSKRCGEDRDAVAAADADRAVPEVVDQTVLREMGPEPAGVIEAGPWRTGSDPAP